MMRRLSIVLLVLGVCACLAQWYEPEERRPPTPSEGSCPGCPSRSTAVDEETKRKFFDALRSVGPDFNLDPERVVFRSMTTKVISGRQYVIQLSGYRDGFPVNCDVTLVSNWEGNQITDFGCEQRIYS